MQRQMGEAHYTTVTDTMTAQDEKDVNTMYDPVTRMISRSAMKITRKVPVRVLPLPPGTTLQPIPMNNVPHQILEEAIAKYSTDVANISGVPASLMAADGSRTNMNVTEAQWSRFYTTCMSREKEATIVLKTFFLEIFGQDTVVHTAGLLWRNHVRRQALARHQKEKRERDQDRDDERPSEQSLAAVNPLDVTTIALARAAAHSSGASNASLSAAEKRMGVWDGHGKRGRRERRSKTNHKRVKTTEGQREDRDAGDDSDEESSSSSSSDESDSDDDEGGVEHPNVDDFEEKGEDSFEIEYDEYSDVSITFSGVLDNSELLDLFERGLLKKDAIDKLVLSDRLSIPKAFIPKDRLDPMTGLSASEMYIQLQAEQARQFDADIRLQAANGGGRGGSLKKPAGGPSSSSSSSTASARPRPIAENKVNRMLGSGASPAKASGLRSQLGGDREGVESREFGRRATRFDKRKAR